MAFERLLRFVRFLGVGAAGFVVDALSFWVFVSIFHFNPWTGRAIAFLLAATTTWFLNRAFVFRSSQAMRYRSQALTYFAATAFSGALNLVAFSVLVAAFGTTSPNLQIAFLAGIGVGLFANYALYSTVVFRS